MTSQNPISQSFKNKKIWVCHHDTLLGSALVSSLTKNSNAKVLVAPLRDLDTQNPMQVHSWVAENKPDIVICPQKAQTHHQIPAAKWYSECLQSYMNIMQAAHDHDVEKFLLVVPSSLYPNLAAQPMREQDITVSAQEAHNVNGYSSAYIAALNLCRLYHSHNPGQFISSIVAPLYGPDEKRFFLQQENYTKQSEGYQDYDQSMVAQLFLKALYAKKFGARAIRMYGTGQARREVLHAQDAAKGLMFLLQNYCDADPINLGSGRDNKMSVLAHKICEIVSYSGKIIFDTSYSDNPQRHLLDSSKIFDLGWRPEIALEEGFKDLYEWYQGHTSSYSSQNKYIA